MQSYRGSSASSSSSNDAINGANGHIANGSSPEDDLLMLHEEVSDFNLSLNVHNADGRKKFNGFELESVAEMDQDTDHRRAQDEDQDMERPSTAGTGASPLSAGSPSDEQETEDGEEEERGRKGRDGRPMGLGAAMKIEEGMETS